MAPLAGLGEIAALIQGQWSVVTVSLLPMRKLPIG